MNEQRWWSGDAAERYWVEIRWAEGIGRSLTCPAPAANGSHNAWYALLGEVQPGDTVYHWNAVEHRFVGRSVVAASVRRVGAEWVVDLAGFVPLRASINLERLRALSPALVALRDRLAAVHGGPLYLPFQYRADGIRMMSNYFAKLPAEAVQLLFDHTGLGEAGAEPPASEEGPALDGPALDGPVGATPYTSFLAPFRAKADTDYLARTHGGITRRGRRHETLVNDFAKWLDARGLIVGRNAAVDLGIANPLGLRPACAATSTLPNISARRWTTT